MRGDIHLGRPDRTRNEHAFGGGARSVVDVHDKTGEQVVEPHVDRRFRRCDRFPHGGQQVGGAVVRGIALVRAHRKPGGRCFRLVGIIGVQGRSFVQVVIPDQVG